MSDIVFQKWIWIIIGLCICIIVLPPTVIWAVLQLPESARAFAVFGIVVLWGIAAGYKDWLMDAKKRHSEETTHE